MAEKKDKGKLNKVAVGAAAVTGLAAGAALGVFAKSDKAKELKKEAEKKLGEVKDKVMEKEEELKGKLADKREDVEEEVDEMKKKAEKVKKDLKS